MMTGPLTEDRPVNHVLPAWDLLGGALGAYYLVSALLRRRMSGEGAEIRLPLSDIAATSLGHLGNVAEVLAAGDRPRMGNDLYGAFGRDFACADGRRLMVVAITAAQWKALLKALQLQPAVAALEAELGVDFAGDEGLRFVHRARLFPLFEAAFAARDSGAWGEALGAAGASWGPYQSLHEAVTSDPRLFLANPLFESVLHPSGMRYPAAGSAATLSGEARGPVARAPRLGEHSDEVLATILGLDQGAIARLHDQGIVA
jgi:2-methylfumaryl-CoA isomerase